MPPRRADAIVVCNCGKRWGNIARASLHEDLEAAELAAIKAAVPRMRRHWAIGCTLKLRDGAPLAYAAVIAKADREMADEAAPAEADDVPRLALEAVRDET